MYERFVRPFLLSLIPPLAFFGVFFLYYGVPTLRKGYSWKEMDWDKDGHTSLSEFILASEVAKHEILLQGKLCTEYFSLTEGSPVRVDCP